MDTTLQKTELPEQEVPAVIENRKLLDSEVAPLLETLRAQLALFSDFHARKETIAWTEIGLYLGFVSALVTVLFTTGIVLALLHRAILSVLVIAIALFSFLFQKGQFELKEYATCAFDATTSLIYQLLDGQRTFPGTCYGFEQFPKFRPIKVKAIVPRGIRQPNLIFDEIEKLYGQNGTQLSEINSQAQIRAFSYITVGAGLAVALLSIWISV